MLCNAVFSCHVLICLSRAYTQYTHTHTHTHILRSLTPLGVGGDYFFIQGAFHTMLCNAVFSCHVLICLSRAYTQYTHTHTHIHRSLTPLGAGGDYFFIQGAFHTMSCNAVFSCHVLICLSRAYTQYTHTHIHTQISDAAGGGGLLLFYPRCVSYNVM